ncbi:unnamed protein product [Rhizophagus irregularis]|nr:unnamed protein product [Rhizophagus irregularis]CAB4405736.1 unnamed protein product [Rhizophagus irregularis]CAB4405788.1 unnamed protein product [Rhizophagus irregularis]
MCYRKSLTNLLLIVKLTKNNNYIGHKGIRRTILCKVLKGGFAIKNWRSSKDHTAIQAIQPYSHTTW